MIWPWVFRVRSAPSCIDKTPMADNLAILIQKSMDWRMFFGVKRAFKAMKARNLLHLHLLNYLREISQKPENLQGADT
jgi:hypothetical protein